MSPAPLEVAAVQAESASGEVTTNVRTAVSLVEEAAADLVVLPELFLTGYDPAAWGAHNTVTPDDARLDPLREAARDTGTVVVVGAAVGPHLSVVVVDRSGATTAPYAKQHMSGPDEQRAFTPGDHGSTITVDGWDLGLGICYDGNHPEHARAAADAGALAYLCPSAFFVGSDHRRDLYYAARALDNGIYVVFAGLVGRCGDAWFSGGSGIYDPEGRPLAKLGNERRGIARATLDADEVARVQQMNPIARDRRPSLGGRVRTAVS